MHRLILAADMRIRNFIFWFLSMGKLWRITHKLNWAEGIFVKFVSNLREFTHR